MITNLDDVDLEVDELLESSAEEIQNYLVLAKQIFEKDPAEMFSSNTIGHDKPRVIIAIAELIQKEYHFQKEWDDKYFGEAD